VRGAVIALALGGCWVGSAAPLADAGEPGTADPDVQNVDPQPSDCPSGAAIYSPYATPGRYPLGAVAAMAWVGPSSPYPNGDEDFSGYGPNMPVMIECSDDKSAVPYLDVTDGCLGAAAVGTYTRGQVHATSDGYYRAVALGYATGPNLPTKWTDQAIEYRFYYSAQVGTNGNPGFKAFVRYRTEDDLYVGSWRTDGTAQIQRKQCGVYTELVILPTFGAPTPNAWHTIRFEAIGDELKLTLDGRLAIDTTDHVFSWGTAGIRIDSMDGAYLDNWRVEAP
jgi:hypothetical protein